jgi:hypothetical protein
VKKLIGFLFIVSVIAFPLLSHFKWEESYLCKDCLAHKTVTEWRMGVQPLGYPLFGRQSGFTERSIRLTDPVEHFTPSVGETLFPPEHQHEWVFAQASPYYLFGKRWGGCLLGAPRRMNPFAYAFLNNADFRADVEERVRSGQLSQSEARAMFLSGKTDPRYARGVRMVRDFLARHPNQMFREAFEATLAAPN